MSNFIYRVTRNIECLATKSVSVYRLVSMYYKNLVKDEVALANIQSTDRVLCIGGGPCPISGILLHEYTKAHVTIVDNDEYCVHKSRELIGNLGYEDMIDVLYGDGSDIPTKDYTVIHVAAQVSPMEQTFCHLKRGCSLGAKVLIRLPKKTLSNFYSINDRSIFNNCCARAVHSGKNVESTALFIKS